MPCQGCSGGDRSSAKDEPYLRRLFDAFWPQNAPFPPLAPYLAAAVTREQAYAWAESMGGSTFLDVADPSTWMSFIGSCMGGDGEFSVRRKKSKKKRPDPPDPPETDFPEEGCGPYDCTLPGNRKGVMTCCIFRDSDGRMVRSCSGCNETAIAETFEGV